MGSRLEQGFSTSIIVATLSAAGAFVVVIVKNHSTTMTRTAVTPPAPPQSRRPLANSTLVRAAGIAPDVCAAAGMTVQQATEMAQRAAAYLEQNRVQLQETLEVAAREKGELARLEDAARRGEAVSEQLERQRQTQGAASTAQTDAIAGLLRAALGDLDEGLVRNIAMIRAQHNLGLPLAYLVDRRTEGEAIAIRDALADQRILAEKGQELDDAKARFLADHAPSRAAVANLENLAAYREAWTAGLGGR